MTDSSHTLIKPGSRKGHKKSRTGCKTCKERKIKCDERRPACLNCISRGVRCPYLRPEEAGTLDDVTEAAPQAIGPRHGAGADKTHAEASSTSNHVPYPSPNSSATGEDVEQTLVAPSQNIEFGSDSSTVVSSSVPNIELELLHHFTFTTYTTFAHSPAVHGFYCTTLVHRGLKCDYLMQALLSVSAQHLAYSHGTSDTAKRDFYIAQGIELQRRAARGAVQYMNRTDLDVEELNNLFFFSILTVHFALANHPHHTSTTPSSSTSIFPEWTFLLNGAKSLAAILGHQAGDHPDLATYREHGKKWLIARKRLLAGFFPDRIDGASTGVFCKVDINTVGNSWPDTASKPSTSANFFPASLEATALRTIRRHVMDSINLRGQMGAQRAVDPTDPEQTPTALPFPLDPDTYQKLLRVYTHALDELDLTFAYIATHPRPLNPQDTLLFLWEVSDSLVPLLQQEPRPAQEAVAIFAHYAIILKMYEEEGEVWWVRGWGRQIVKQAYDALDEGYRPWIAWPLRVFGLDSQVDVPQRGLGNTMEDSVVPLY